jgi:hypothetical protein
VTRTVLIYGLMYFRRLVIRKFQVESTTDAMTESRTACHCDDWRREPNQRLYADPDQGSFILSLYAVLPEGVTSQYSNPFKIKAYYTKMLIHSNCTHMLCRKECKLSRTNHGRSVLYLNLRIWQEPWATL